MNKYLEKIAELHELEKEAGLAGAAGWVAGKTSKALSGTKNFLKKDWEATKARSAERTTARKTEFAKAKSAAKGSSSPVSKTTQPPSQPMHEVKPPSRDEGVGSKVRVAKKTVENTQALENRQKAVKGLRGKARTEARTEASLGTKKKYKLTYTNEN